MSRDQWLWEWHRDTVQAEESLVDGAGAEGAAVAHRSGPWSRRAMSRALGRAGDVHDRHRVLVRVVAVGLVASVISLGVIVLNNSVMNRTAELGRLEKERRALRTENAVLASEIARLSAPHRIVTVARKKLGMVPPAEMPRFLYLDESNSPRRRPALPVAGSTAAIPGVVGGVGSSADGQSSNTATGSQSVAVQPLEREQ